MLISSAIHNVFVFSIISVSLRNVTSLSLSLPSSIFIQFWILYFFWCPSIGALQEAMFDCYCMGSTCRIYACWLLVIYSTSNDHVFFQYFNTVPTQFNLILPTTFLGILPLFNTWFDVVKFAITIFSLPLPFGIYRPPDSQV